MSIVIKDNSKEVIREMNRKVPIILDALGSEAEGNAVSEITALGAVDTGRLRNSITHATLEYHGKSSYTDKEGNRYSDANAKSSPGSDSVYIGTNVEYAPYIELGTSKMSSRPFLKNAVSGHTNDYKKIVEDGLKS
jgi:HK97 gp10 family phage protein